jgi:hypothetical protein
MDKSFTESLHHFSNIRTIFFSFVYGDAGYRILYHTDFLIYRQYKQLVEEAVRQKKSTKAKYISCTDIIFLQYLGKLKIDVFDETKRECNIFFAFI